MNHFIRKLIVVSYSICLPAIALLYLGGCTSKARVDANIEPKSVHSQITSQAKQKLVEKAEAITVKIYAGENTGSGILLKYQDETYTVVTNRHVIAHEKSYLIQTPDGVKHQATLLNSSTDEDLALLQFESDRSYTIAEIGNASEQYDRELFASGFPYNSDKLQLSAGKFALQLDTPLKDGYQIGYTNDIQSGMSGGAILDANGKVIGVNARSANPVVPDYQFTNGTRPSEQQEKQLSQLSWGIPIYKVADLAPKLALIPPSSKPLTSQAELFEFDPNTLTEAANDVYQTAQKITVRIDSEHGNGSGVIVAKQDNTYYVLTASHVVDNQNKKYHVVTVDGVKHSVEPSTVSSLPGVDLAVVRFTSNKDYDVAALSTHQSNKKLPTFLYGWARFDNQPKATFSSGYLQPKDFNFGNIKDSFSTINGNDLVYTNFSYGGMSGGSLLDSEGRVIGINTAVESERDDLDRFYMGHSLGISTTTVNALLEKLDLKRQWLNLTNSQPKAISSQDVESLYKNNKYLINPEVEKANLDYQGWMNYGNLLWRISNYEKAIQAFDRAIDLKEDSYQAYYAKGLSLKSLNRTSQARQLFSNSIEINPKFYPAQKQIVLLISNSEDMEKALSIIDRTLTYYPNDYYFRLLKSLTLAYFSKYDEAVKEIDATIEINPSHYFAYFVKGAIYAENQQYKLAIENLNKSIDINPASIMNYLGRAGVYSELKQHELVIGELDKVIELSSGYETIENLEGIYILRGEAYSELNKHNLAIKNYDKAITLNSKNPFFYSKRASEYIELSKYDQAINDYTRAIQLNPNYANAYYNRGIAYRKVNKLHKAIDDYTKAVKINNNQPSYYNNRGTTFNELKQYNSAIADLNKAVELSPNDNSIYFNRGIVYENLKEYQLAMRDYSKAIELNPHLVFTYLKRGRLNFKLQQKEKGLNDLKMAAQLYKNKGNTKKYLEVQEIIQSIE